MNVVPTKFEAYSKNKHHEKRCIHTLIAAFEHQLMAKEINDEFLKMDAKSTLNQNAP